MLTKIKRFLVLVIFSAFAFTLVGCDSTSSAIKSALKEMELELEITDEVLTLPGVYVADAVTEWTSSDTKVIEIEGTEAYVYRTDKEQSVTLTVTVTAGEITETKSFDVVVKALNAATSVKIDTSSFKKDEAGFLLQIGKSYDLEIEEMDGFYIDPVWSSSKSKFAKVEGSAEEGYKLVGCAEGQIKLTVKSSTDNSVSDTVEIFVCKNYKPETILLAEYEAIMEQMPKFINQTQFLPESESDYIEVKYIDSTSKVELTDNEYIFVRGGTDHKEQFEMVLSYRGTEISREIELLIVTNPEDNEFLQIEEAIEYIKEYFKKYNSEEAEYEKIYAKAATTDDPNEDCVAYNAPATYTTQYGTEDARATVSLTYDCSYIGNFSPCSFVDVTDTTDTTKVLSSNLICYKPNDDVSFSLKIYVKSKNNFDSVTIPVVAGGYTQEEIIQYLAENTLPQANDEGKYEVTCKNITLPSIDATGKFANLAITWKSSNAAVLSDDGKFVNMDLSESTPVTMTATVKYDGTVNAKFKFEQTLEFNYTVNPAESNAQIVALQVGNYVMADEFFSQIKYFPFGKKDRLDADGNVTNVMPLPKKVSDLTSELANYADLEIAWTANEDGLLDENYKLLKQYLRYHEAVLTYTVTVDGVSATGEVVVNVGITEVQNAVYIGGNYYQQSETGKNAGDALSQLSKFDASVGNLKDAAKIWGFSYNHGEFNGLTWYLDKVDEKTGITVRYQYFAAVNGYMTLDDQYGIELDAPEGAAETDTSYKVLVNGMYNPDVTGDASTVKVILNEELNANIGTNYGGNWASIFYNATDHDIQIPMSPYAASAFLGSADVKWENHPFMKNNVIARDNAFGMDGYRVGFVCDKDGKVVMGSGDTQLQVNYDADGDGKLTAADYWVTIPAGGYAYTPKTQQHNATINGLFCFKGVQLQMSWFEPYQLSADGNSEGLGTFAH